MFKLSRRHQPTLPEAQLRTAWQLVAALFDYPTQELLDGLAVVDEANADLPGAVSVPLARLVTHLREGDLRSLQEECRRHLRPHPAVCALPDLLRLRGHPQAGRCTGAVQAGLSQGRCRVRRRRAARPPVCRAPARRVRGRRGCVAAAARPPSRAGDAPDGPDRGRLAVGRCGGGTVRDPAGARGRGAGRRTTTHRAGAPCRGGRSGAVPDRPADPCRAAERRGGTMGTSCG